MSLISIALGTAGVGLWIDGVVFACLRRERAADALAGLGQLLIGVANFLDHRWGWSVLSLLLATWHLYRWWNNHDDDWKKRKRRVGSWVKSHIPKPTIVVIRPIQQPA